MIQKFQLKAEEKQIQFITNLQETPFFAYADIALIERALENLIENAIHYTPKRGSIHFTVSVDREDISVQIRDTGPGISQEDLPHIFNRFYQLDKRRKGETGHSGLGLSITKKILKLHNRSIQVSSSIESGTTFTFTIPMSLPI